MKRVKLDDDPKVKPLAEGNNARQTSNKKLTFEEETSSGGGDGSGGASAPHSTEEDLLLEQMLRKRQLSMMRKKVVMADSSYKDLDAEIQEEESRPRQRQSVAETASKHKSKSGVFRPVEDFGGTSSTPTSPNESNDGLGDQLRGAESINTFLKERILYHGPLPYMQDYLTNKAKYEVPLPKPGKRIRQTSTEMIMEVVEVKEVKSDDSNLSLSEIGGGQPGGSLLFNDANMYEHDLPPADAEADDLQKDKDDWAAPTPMAYAPKKEVTNEESLMSITEKICLLETEGKFKPMSLKERYVGHKQVKGYPTCSDRTEGFPECLPPGELVRKAIRTDELWGIPQYTPLTKNQLIDLMTKIEQYPNSDYVCLVYATSPKSPLFNPYCFQIVRFRDVDQHQYYTLSKYGLLHFTHGFSEYISIVQFQRQMHIFDRIRKIPFFVQYRMYKSFHIWRSNIRRTRIKKNRKQLDELLFCTKRPLRRMMMELFKMSDKMCQMGFLSMRANVTYAIKDFLNHQEARLHEIYMRFRTFEAMVVEMTQAACRSHLIDMGFSPDDYASEHEYYVSGLDVPVDNLAEKAFSIATYPGQWLPYSMQAKKRRVCTRLSHFIKLIDYYVQRTYHRLMKNSIILFMCELEHRTQSIPKEFTVLPKHKFKFHLLRHKNEKMNGRILISGGIEPMFDIGCSWDEDSLIFSPTNEDFIKSIRLLMSWWKNALFTYQNMLPKPEFNPYTQPIVNGYMDQKVCGDGPELDVLVSTDPDLKDIYETIEQILNHGFESCKLYIESFDYIRLFCIENDKVNVNIFRAEDDVLVLTAWLEKYHTQLEVIEKLENEQSLGIFRVINRVLRENAYPTVMRLIEVLHEVVPILGGKCVRALIKRMEKALNTLETYPETADEYVDYLLFLDDIQEQMDDIERDLDICSEIFDLIDMYDIPGNDEDVGGFGTLVPLLSQLRNIIDKQTLNREQLMKELLEQFRIDTEKIFADMAEISEIAQAAEVLDPKTDPQPMTDKLTDCRDTLLAHQERAAKFNSYQKQLKLEVTNYDELDKLLIEVKLRHQLWDSVTSWAVEREEWDVAQFHQLDQEELTREVNRFVKSIQQLEKGLPENEVVPILKTKVESMRAKLPLIANLQNPNMKRRHWDILEKAMNRNLTDEHVTLRNLEESGVQNFAELIQEISAQASSEFSLEALLKKVEDSWKDIEFMVIPHKDQRDVFILGGTDDIQVLLDDSNIHMATIASSRHVGPIKHKVDEWSRLLDLFGKTLEEWLNCQRNWIYLESIFCAPDIQRQLPNESKMFGQVDKSWRDIMSRTNKMPVALRAATAPGLLEQLQTNNDLLEQIMKCLDDYLESKRVIFPRFYFLSNEELLEILAQTRNPQAVQPHLRKCFDAIQKLEFGGPANAVALDVLAMYSPEEERVTLTKGLKARGNVEDWLGKVEDAMTASLKKSMRNTLSDYHVFEREEWLQKFPSQCVLTISQLMWAQFVHEILDGPGNKLDGMKGFEQKNFDNLNKLAAMVRGQLSSLVRAVLCALITVDVHARDIITTMVQKKVDNSNNFEWLKQLRYYWIASDEVAVAKMANAKYLYGYEYLGASPRLVITPLTDRCYLCLMGALQLDLGGAPAGPAGTGKTETTKDLAKSLAFMCVVFNCSEGLDYKMMGRFFSGLAQSGGWCCFDEFNRIDIEVLSVIAQQLITIRLAKVQKLTRFLFEGREIKLIKTCSAFITMNPGYAGRTELPDNLKALFRPISMMVPDYTLIAEVILYSEGFESSKSLANKMTQMYKLCSEQLSQQDHYDFGMRAVKSVLVMAGSLKRANPNINENIVLIRALRDSNLPKFLAHDAILLHGIIQDLFPGVVIPEQDYGVLQKEAVKCCFDKGLQSPDYFILKVIQFYETLVVRHGVMLVGKTGGGKTTCYEVLKSALSSLFANKVEGPNFRNVDTYVLNPKAVSMGELYGEVNPLTLEWRDGLLGIMVRASVKPKMTHHQWVICDGPVDAIWIENMNTVLDDNKMLCLANSERIKLTNWVRMIFEVQDLAQASPATVSRCGMVYVDNSNDGMGWKPFVETYIKSTKLPAVREELRPYLKDLFFKYVDQGLLFVQKKCQEIIPQATLGKVSMMCSILTAILTKKTMDYDLEVPKFMQLVCQIFIFAYVWSVGGNIHENDYDKFSDFVRGQFENEENCKLPKSGTLWSFYNNLETRKMDFWETLMPAFIYNPKISFVDILVPTVDTVRFGFLMELLLSVNRAVLFTGPTGTGKSAIAKYVLSTISGKNEYVPNFINFSAQTTSKRTQEMIEGKLEKRKKSLLSAPIGKKVIFFLDDLNMPKLDRYGAQPALELLRQLLDFNGCYDRAKNYWKELQNVILSAACAPPGGGRNQVTPRLLRHFCMLAIPTPTTKVLQQIYRAIMRGFLEEFDPDLRTMADVIVSASIDTYQFMAAQYRPTIAKAHYVFNMRDLSKCIQGILQANKAVIVTKKSMVRLYYHECQRVFHDRLTDDNDRNIFCNSLAELCTNILQEPTDAEEMKGIIFGDFIKMGVDRENRIYDEIVNKEKLKTVLSDYLDEYNITTSKEMALVFFADATEHVARIARILRTDRGNALLVGVGGAGKQSLTKLASYISGYQCFQIELMRGYDYNSFHDDLKKLYDVAGLKNEPIVFLFTDTQIAMEEFLEDINNILNSGEVPNLLEPEDQERMMAGVKSEAKSLGINDADRDVVYDYFIRRIRSNLHVVLCMSPVGDSFRLRCRMFPSLVNCCTINWFCEWPTEALLSVANNFMSKIELGKGVTADAMAAISVLVHESVTEMSDRYYEEMRRKFYTTPSSYLELISLYTSMLNERREKIYNGKARIQNGLTKLLETNVLVKEMRIQLKDLEPILVQKSQAVENLMVKLAEDQAAADTVRTNVQVDEAAAKEKAIETQAVAEDAQKDLAEALPALEAAVKALDALDKNDITEIRAFQKPPTGVRTVLETVCILFNVKPDWNSSRLLLSDSNFLKKLMDFDKDGVTEATLKKLKPYIDDKDFQPEKVAKVSKACKSICMWVRAIDIYGKVFKTVEPKRNRYLAAQAELDQTMETLRVKQAQLNEVERKIAKLQEFFQNTIDEKQSLEDNMELTAARLRRAGKLTSALANEQSRWTESVKKFDEDLENLIGDVFVGAACIAYFGAFTSHYRQILVRGWVERCIELGLPVTENFTLTSFADPFEIRVWNQAGLPRDNTSTENAVLATRGRRWALMIDPQDQANRWVKQMESDKGLKVLKFSDPTFMRTMENCVRLGLPALLEEVGEALDPSLEPILLRQVFVQAGRTMIRLGDSNVDYDSNFRLYMTTKMANPHYLPEVCIKVTLINFTVTMSGLEDQLLCDVVEIERPDLESQRQTLVSQINTDKNMLVSLETKILRLLFQSEGNILDDEELIQALNDSKETSAAIIKRLAEAEVTEEKINKSRESYRPAAARGSVLYFVVAQLAELDPMYQYSLKYFTQVFKQCIASIEATEELEERLRVLKKETTFATYVSISRGLFEKDKLVFSFMLCTDVMKSRDAITEEEWSFFLRGGIGVEGGRTKKPSQATWITAQQWNNICDLESTFEFMADFALTCLGEAVRIRIGSFKYVIFQRKKGVQYTVNDVWDQQLTRFQKLLIIKATADEKLVEAVTQFVHEELGKKFIESPAIDLNLIYKDLNNTTPLIFVLSVGSDPMAAFHRFSSELGYQDRVQSISLGQGQGPVAEAMIRTASFTGDWVFLQNCHLAASWMPSLERIVKRMSENSEDINSSYRLYLSSMPTGTFPVSVLQDSVKITNEPPKGLRANVRRAMVDMDKEAFEKHLLGMDWRRMIFGICLFHAVIQERKKFGPLGWNIKYEFNDSDRDCCLLNLDMFCKTKSIPWDALEYITGQITYGGRITDNWDQRCLTTILKGYFSKKTLKSNYKYSPSGLYYAPNAKKIGDFIKYIDKLPILDEPEIFGMHENANITFLQQESNALMTSILAVQPRQSGGSAASAKDELVLDQVSNIESKLPSKIDIDKGNRKLFATDLRGRLPSLSVFLNQEIDRFNKLLGVMRNTLDQLRKGIKGLIVMSDDLERMYYAFLNNQVPDVWTKVSYGSLKTLSSWYADLDLRVKFINSWLTGLAPPSSYWLSGFFFQQGFLTSCLQTFARKYSLPIDQLKFVYTICPVIKSQQAILDPVVEKTIVRPRDGVLVHGLFLEAARWDMQDMQLADEYPGETISMLPVIHFLPALSPPAHKFVYNCPLYKTSIRAGVLSTTGHSTNFIVAINLPTKQPEDYWILKGTALLSQLTD